MITPAAVYRPRHKQDVAALSEGICPDCLNFLALDAGGTVRIHPYGTWQPGGWCPRCRIWWHIRKDSEFPICAMYPIEHAWATVTI